MQPAPPDLTENRFALFLDVDGTLLEFEEHPDDVRAEPGLVELLSTLCRHLDGAMSLVSGRTLADIDRIFAPSRFPAAGAHGAELRLANGEKSILANADLPGAVIEALTAFVESHAGLLLERKPGGVSLHYRRAPELESECRRQVGAILAEISDDFRLIDGKMVLDLAPRGVNKGEAIRTLLARAPYSGKRPVFVGDDVTDEDGFRTVNAHDGISIVVGNAQNSVARFMLPDVDAVVAWLCAIIGGLVSETREEKR